MNFDDIPNVSSDTFVNILNEMLVNLGGLPDSIEKVSLLDQTNLLYAILLQIELNGTGGGGGTSENFANTNLTANQNRVHNFNKKSLVINNLNELEFSGIPIQTIVITGQFVNGQIWISKSELQYFVPENVVSVFITGTFYGIGQITNYERQLTYVGQNMAHYLYDMESVPPSNGFTVDYIEYNEGAHLLLNLTLQKKENLPNIANPYILAENEFGYIVKVLSSAIVTPVVHDAIKIKSQLGNIFNLTIFEDTDGEGTLEITKQL